MRPVNWARQSVYQLLDDFEIAENAVTLEAAASV
jgi:hypothetical protein